MNFRTMRVNADLNLLNPQPQQTFSFRLANHDAISLESHVEKQAPGILQDLKEITTHEYFPTAERKKQRARLGQLIQYILNFGNSHLAEIIVLQIAVNATFVDRKSTRLNSSHVATS